jgi:hypothetical protein
MMKQIKTKRKFPEPVMMKRDGISSKIIVKLERYCGTIVVLRKKSKYLPEVSCNTKMVKRMASFGLMPEEIAFIYGVTGLQFLKAVYGSTELCKALDAGAQIADYYIRDSLFKKAAGYEVKAIKRFRHKGKVKYMPYTKHIRPDIQAIIFWLINRCPNEWKLNPGAGSAKGPKLDPEYLEKMKQIADEYMKEKD